LHRGIDGSDPVRPEPITRLLGTEEERRDARSLLLATGTLACPRCDAPVAPDGPMAPPEPLDCPYCGHRGAVREFLSLEAPSRPARVDVRVVRRFRPTP
jgi:DNA-directed RNA polymerase subunit RPC12/RpoP